MSSDLYIKTTVTLWIILIWSAYMGYKSALDKDTRRGTLVFMMIFACMAICGVGVLL